MVPGHLPAVPTQDRPLGAEQQLSCELGVSYNTVWKLKHKLLQVMHERNQGETPTERIEIDDAYLGGEWPGKRGCGTEHKAPFVAAVQTDDNGHPQRAEVRRYAQAAIAPGSRVVNGLGCFRAFDTPAYTHERLITGGGHASAQIPAFNWVNTVLGNVKNAITGSYHAIRGQHVRATWPSSSTASIGAMTSRP